ncbi:MAG: TRAP transporter substrate-binding protein DctP [Acetobacteraceae bacterium]|nr:TRAP transporter substrate-binding protein DctP [Acetobacteraceae bacterium]
MSTAAPPADFLAVALERFRTEVERAGVGLTVQTHPASTLFRQGTEVPALQRGTLEMSTMTTFEVAQQLPAYGFFDRAFLLRDYPHLRAVFEGPVGDRYREEVRARMGIRILSVAYLGTRELALRHRQAVAVPSDLGGIKLRMPSGPEWLLLGRALGASPVPLGMPEVYLGLKTGTIDAQENPLSIFNAAKLYEVSEQVVLTAHLVQPVFIDIAEPFYQRLDAHQRQVVEAAARTAAEANDRARLADESSVLGKLKSAGLTITTVDPGPFRSLAHKVYAEAEAARAWDATLQQRVGQTP